MEGWEEGGRERKREKDQSRFPGEEVGDNCTILVSLGES